jgi:hypothetical protein
MPSAMMRPTISEALPAEPGTISVTGPVGKFCAWAAPERDKAAAPAMATTRGLKSCKGSSFFLRGDVSERTVLPIFYAGTVPRSTIISPRARLAGIIV